MTRAGFSVFRRNERRGQPITIKDAGEFGYWIDNKTVEVLAEIGFSPDSQSYHTDRFIIDLDPRDNFPLADLKAVTKEAYRRLRRHPWVDEELTYLHWTGGKGFHVVGHFRDSLSVEVEAVRLELEPLIASLCDDETTFIKPLTSVYQPHVVLDISPIMRRGVYRNTFSFHAATGGICVPVKPEKLESFDPERESAPEIVLSILDQMTGQSFDNYHQLISAYLRLR
ncbi:MAG TPA: hypothetical protein PKY82_35860 [Pyrinomonadaceae bacterium]|nr:hypothetical protein [Pyrinomonadaceae bacterium]